MQSSVFQSFTWLCGVGLTWGAEECISEFYLVMWCRSGVGCRGVYFRVFTWLSGVGLGWGAEECISECLPGVGLGRVAEECISDFLPGYLV